MHLHRGLHARLWRQRQDLLQPVQREVRKAGEGRTNHGLRSIVEGTLNNYSKSRARVNAHAARIHQYATSAAVQLPRRLALS